MRSGFAHDAVLRLDDDGDHRAPGGAITEALCGGWSHPPPCPLAPHHTRAHHSGDEVSVRLLFAAEPDDEQRVRSLVENVLTRGWGDDPDGARTTWRLVSSGRSDVRPAEAEHVSRLIRS
jgi:hypothetical protein